MSVNQTTIPPSALATICQPGTSSRILLLLAATVVGCAVGALFGAVGFASMGTDVTARSLVRVTKPQNLAAIAAGATFTTPEIANNLADYVSGEAAFLSGPGFSLDVSNKLGNSTPANISVGYDRGTSVISVSSSSASATEAIGTVAAALDVYAQHLRLQGRRELDYVSAALDAWETVAAESRDEQELRKIRGLREQVRLLAAHVETFELLQGPTLEATTSRPGDAGLMLGTLIGGASSALLMLRHRRRSGGLSAGDVADAVEGVFIPAVDLSDECMQDFGRRLALARLLHAQCRSGGGRKVIVLIGASPRSGVSQIASLFQTAAAETGSANALRLDQGSALAVRGSEIQASLVVNAGEIGDSGLLAAYLDAATDLVVVARIDLDTALHMEVVRSAAASAEIPLTAVMTYRTRRWFDRRSKRTSIEMGGGQ